MILLPMSKELNSDFLGNHRGAAQVLEDDHLAILTLALEDGSLTMSPSQQPKAPNLCGGGPGCLAAGLITGAEYLSGSALLTSRGKIPMV